MPESERSSTYPSRGQLAVFVGYAAAAALYILIGVFVPNFLLSLVTAIAYLLVVAWLVPVLVRRLLSARRNHHSPREEGESEGTTSAESRRPSDPDPESSSPADQAQSPNHSEDEDHDDHDE